MALSALTANTLEVEDVWIIIWWCSLVSDSNQEKIVDEGGLDALLMLLQSSRNMTILRVASGAIANLAMNGKPDYLE